MSTEIAISATQAGLIGAGITLLSVAFIIGLVLLVLFFIDRANAKKRQEAAETITSTESTHEAVKPEVTPTGEIPTAPPTPSPESLTGGATPSASTTGEIPAAPPVPSPESLTGGATPSASTTGEIPTTPPAPAPVSATTSAPTSEGVPTPPPAPAPAPAPASTPTPSAVLFSSIQNFDKGNLRSKGSNLRKLGSAEQNPPAVTSPGNDQGSFAAQAMNVTLRRTPSSPSRSGSSGAQQLPLDDNTNLVNLRARLKKTGRQYK